MPEPLSGIRVVEMAVALQGPAAALFLGDMGAEVIKVEPPIGDGSRYYRGVNNTLPPEAQGSQFIARYSRRRLTAAHESAMGQKSPSTRSGNVGAPLATRRGQLMSACALFAAETKSVPISTSRSCLCVLSPMFDFLLVVGVPNPKSVTSGASSGVCGAMNGTYRKNGRFGSRARIQREASSASRKVS